ncbi:hypothetical protein BGW42_005017 [Actinomortierella wolfii]|nr:hypothetical protein BGW42_005017 [Actinomortierella wolfii]
MSTTLQVAQPATDTDIGDNNPIHRLTKKALQAKEQNEYVTKINADPKGAPHMALQHDTYQRTVTVISLRAIKNVKELGYKIVPSAATTPTTCTKYYI